jgi:nucleolar protein 15
MSSKATNKKAARKVMEKIATSDTENEDAEQSNTDNEIIRGIGGSTDGEDSSDEEGVARGDPFKSNLPLIEMAPGVRERLDKKVKELQSGAKPTPGVVYLGRIPHGFYEEEMRQYFSQFGTVSRLRLSRNKKTGRSKHYAFIEFVSEEVAQIVAETMDNYLLFDHLLKCKVVPGSSVHENMWEGANIKFRTIPWTKVNSDQHNKPMTEARQERILKTLLQKESQKRKRLEEMGIDYEFSGYAGATEPKGKQTKN